MVSEWTPTTPLPCDSLTKSINKDPRPKESNSYRFYWLCSYVQQLSSPAYQIPV